MARIEVTANNFPGSAFAGSGTDTLVLKGGGTFDFAYVTLSGISEIVSEAVQGDYPSIRISGDQLAGVTSLARSTSSRASLTLTGTNIDLSGKTFSNFDVVYVADNQANVTVSNLALALKLRAFEGQGETITLNGPITTPASRADLFSHGFDRIVEGSNVWIDAAPTLTGLSGSFDVREGGSVRLDPDGNALISDDGGPIASLAISVSDTGSYFVMNDFEVSSNFKIVDNSFDQTLMYKGTVIGQIGRGYIFDEARISFNQSATAEMINEFVRGLAYTPGDFVYAEHVTVTITAYDKGGRKAQAVLTVNAETNWTPTEPTLTGTSVAENATAGQVVGTLKATDANGDPIRYKLTDDAGGRFSIMGDKLVASGTVPLDFEKAASHKVTVVANDGEKDGLPATFTISVTDVREEISGSKGKDKLVGTAGQDLLNGYLGNDTLTGGSGNDVFAFTTKLGKNNVDKISDFLPKQDKIYLENAIFKKLLKVGALKKEAFHVGSQSQDKQDRIIYNKKTGALSYDQDGTGSSKAVHFATLTNKANLEFTDLWVI
jgi:Ca2+-binding RTX toxin-like protein